MVVMRDAAIDAFKPEPFYTVRIMLGEMTAESGRFAEKAEAEDLAKRSLQSGTAFVKKVERKERQRNRLPFMTLQAFRGMPTGSLGLPRSRHLIIRRVFMKRSWSRIPGQTAGISLMIWPEWFQGL